MKLLGLATGAVVASVGVWAFGEWRNVSDEELLMSALNDHCLPYVLDGSIPFMDMGRAIGVYDNVDADERIFGGEARLVFNARFVASWGEVAEASQRACRIEGRSMDAAKQAFEVEPELFVERITHAIRELGKLNPLAYRLQSGGATGDHFQKLVWLESDLPPTRNGQVVMLSFGSKITYLQVTRDISE